MSTMTRVETQRLLVTRRDPHSRLYETVGQLSLDDDTHVFSYAPGVSRPLPGMPDLERLYRSCTMFPLFEHRVISPRRADHDNYLAGLSLPPEATPFEVLARSGGRSAVDTLELTPIPEPGPVDILFLVHGIRHLSKDERDHIGSLAHGDGLRLVPEPDNPVDEDALLVCDHGHRLGYAPRPLLPYVHQIIQDDYRLTVDRVNSESAGFHMRLLVRLEGILPTSKD